VDNGVRSRERRKGALGPGRLRGMKRPEKKIKLKREANLSFTRKIRKPMAAIMRRKKKGKGAPSQRTTESAADLEKGLGAITGKFGHSWKKGKYVAISNWEKKIQGLTAPDGWGGVGGKDYKGDFSASGGDEKINCAKLLSLVLGKWVCQAKRGGGMGGNR